MHCLPSFNLHCVCECVCGVCVRIPQFYTRPQSIFYIHAYIHTFTYTHTQTYTHLVFCCCCANPCEAVCPTRGWPQSIPPVDCCLAQPSHEKHKWKQSPAIPDWTCSSGLWEQSWQQYKPREHSWLALCCSCVGPGTTQPPEGTQACWEFGVEQLILILCYCKC